MVPSQRLIFNLHVIDGYSLTDAAALIESSEATVKSNLEKARYNFQKNLEKSIKQIKA
jgi:RNA polymerase sigma-70 factor (ECF subfamily)